MARIRSIKPEYFENEVLASLDKLARILFPGLWCLADREGRLEYRPTRIKARILPYDECDISNLLCALEETKFISKYEANGEVYIQIENFAKHQRPHSSEPPSVIPPPPTVNKIRRTAEKKNRTAEKIRLTVNRKGREGKGEERKGEEGRVAREVGTPTKGDAAPPPPTSHFFSDPYLDELQADPANAGVEVRYVAAKMIRWCINHGKEITKERLLSWLHREYPNRKGNGSDGSAGNTKAKIARVVQDIIADHSLD